MILGLNLLELVLLLYAAIIVFVSIASIALFLGFPPLSPPEERERWPHVSIIVPVRNQRESIAGCIESLVAQDYPNKEIIVVDGGSDDGTLEVLGSFDDRIELLQEPPLPRGWVGKNWACHNGFKVARGEFLLFTDGDTIHHPDLLRRAVSLSMREQLDLLTIYPRMRVLTFWERTVLPLMIFLIGLTHRGSWVNRPDKPWAIGNGQFLLFRRSAYEEIGGHEAVRDRVDEDYRLSILTKSKGFKMLMADGRDVLEVRMYRSLREVWAGFAKNAFPGLDFSLSKTIRSAAGLILLMVVPFVLLTIGLSHLALGMPSVLLPVGAATSIAIWIRVSIAYAFISGRASYALLTPLSALIIAAILLDSARLYLRRGGVRWKGRLYGIPGR